jgi:rhodanese-related sulfurtransferase
MTRVSPEEAHAKMQGEGYVYLDVRPELDFEEAHPLGAQNIPLDDPSQFVEAVEARFAKDAKLVVGCRSGVQSLRAAHLLESAGFSFVLEQRAGFVGTKTPFGQTKEKGWHAAGLPIERGPAPKTPETSRR